MEKKRLLGVAALVWDLAVERLRLRGSLVAVGGWLWRAAGGGRGCCGLRLWAAGI